MLRLTAEQVADCMKRMRSGNESAPAKKPKYRNHKVRLDGRTFASKLEAGRYVDLKMMEAAGVIHGLRCQVSFRLEVNSLLVCRYVADFTYFMKGGLVQIIEDAKGCQTPEYLLKKKLMLAIHGIAIQEFKKGPRRARKS